MFNRLRLRACRHAAGLTQKELAKLSGCPSNSISRIELGHWQPSREVQEALAKALGVDPQAFADPPAETRARGLSRDEQAMLNDFRRLAPQEQVAVRWFVTGLAAGHSAEAALAAAELAGAVETAEDAHTRPASKRQQHG